jgi:nucleotide-binding universal stress UspA family protein
MYKKILVPVDGSRFSECILSHARAIALGSGNPEVDLLFVVEPILSPAAELSGSMQSELEDGYESWGKDYVDKVAASLRENGVAAKGVVLKGKAADVVLEYAEKNNVDLIIMSTHGRSGPVKWLFGSVTEKVVRHSSIPVLVATPPDCRLSSDAPAQR